MVVFPELALSEQTFDSLARYLAELDIILIAGIASPGRPAPDEDASNDSHVTNSENIGIWEAGTNSVRVAFPLNLEDRKYLTSEQFKHHRWRLDRSQIVQYSLGSSLGTDCSWWEHINISRREVTFLHLQPWLTASVLICEDLARQDPVSTLVRAVGPNLVIALLMDGPQCTGRWADRYASVLADDPGSSVLTFTNAGMASRSKPRSMWNEVPKDYTIVALWRDSMDGTTEIRLYDKSAAIALTLNSVVERQFTADGREATEYPRNTLVLSGVTQIEGTRVL
jgi:hypothetical protein